MESDLSDLSYLYRFGAYISPEEEKTAAFLNSLPEEEIRKMADTYTDGYIRGFEVMGRDLSKKKTVSVRYPIGFERMVRQAVKNLRGSGAFGDLLQKCCGQHQPESGRTRRIRILFPEQTV